MARYLNTRAGWTLWVNSMPLKRFSNWFRDYQRKRTIDSITGNVILAIGGAPNPDVRKNAHRYGVVRNVLEEIKLTNPELLDLIKRKRREAELVKIFAQKPVGTNRSEYIAAVESLARG